MRFGRSCFRFRSLDRQLPPPSPPTCLHRRLTKAPPTSTAQLPIRRNKDQETPKFQRPFLSLAASEVWTLVWSEFWTLVYLNSEHWSEGERICKATQCECCSVLTFDQHSDCKPNIKSLNRPFPIWCSFNWYSLERIYETEVVLASIKTYLPCWPAKRHHSGVTTPCFTS